MRTSTLLIWILVLGLPFGGCKKKDGAGGGAGGGEPVAATSGGANAEQAEALKQAFESSEDCQRMVACCSGLGGSTWEQTLSVPCQRFMEKSGDFAEQAKNEVNVAWLLKDCQNQLAAFESMANASNPLPPACQKDGAAAGPAAPAPAAPGPAAATASAPPAGSEMCTAVCTKEDELGLNFDDRALLPECIRRCNNHLTYGGPHRELVEQVHGTCLPKASMGEFIECIGKINAEWQAQGKPRDGTDWIQWDYDSVCNKGKGCNEGE